MGALDKYQFVDTDLLHPISLQLTLPGVVSGEGAEWPLANSFMDGDIHTFKILVDTGCGASAVFRWHRGDHPPFKVACEGRHKEVMNYLVSKLQQYIYV